MLLSVEHLKTYLRIGGQTLKAVDDISFCIEKGETFCLVGESGSGKSVTALSVMQLLPAAISSHPAGRIGFDYRHRDGSIEQVDILRLSEPRKRALRGGRIAMIFQEPMTSLNPVLTVGEQVMEAIQLHHPGMGYADARAQAVSALAAVQIPQSAKRMGNYPHHLSGGQRQRVMIAMAMAGNPDLLIADEPTTALDVTIQAEILRLMKTLQEREGMGILFITHDLAVVSQIAEHVAVMKLGRIVESGSLDAVLRRSQHAYTRALIASLPQNLKRRRPGAREKHAPSPPSKRGSVAYTFAVRQRPSRPRGDHQPLIVLQDLQVHFPIKKGLFRRTVEGIRAVDSVDLSIVAGQVLALVGESGCGKTTLGLACLRLIEPTGGRIRFGGRDITALPRGKLRPFRREMQIVFQDPMSSLNPRLRIATALTEPMAAHGIGRSREERLDLAARILERVQLEPEHLWRYPHEFSGGQRQRICIARALVLNPRFIVCDEVTSALDVSVQAEILQMLLRLRRERNLTLLFITHDIAVVEYVSDEVAVMHAGRIVERGPTERVCATPHHEYTQSLLAAVPRISL
ncbi:MAG: dipeptide ABC transporter ATP-binding protein [Gammaproteobacteria bacterium]